MAGWLVFWASLEFWIVSGQVQHQKRGAWSQFTDEPLEPKLKTL
jgi:hypothetical protein